MDALLLLGSWLGDRLPRVSCRVRPKVVPIQRGASHRLCLFPVVGLSVRPSVRLPVCLSICLRVRVFVATACVPSQLVLVPPSVVPEI